MKKVSLILFLAIINFTLFAQNNDRSSTFAGTYYNESFGQNAPKVADKDEKGDVKRDRLGNIVYKEATKDHFGNAVGNQNDLAKDGAFEGQTILVIQLYDGRTYNDGFDFELPKKALKEKGFNVVRYIGYPPSADSLKKDLEKSCQLWVISDNVRKLNDDHLKVIKDYWNAGNGLYIWGDNDPYYADANALATYLFGGSMLGNLYGAQEVGLQDSNRTDGVGLVRRHLITTGLEHVYEGITIATIQPNQELTPIIYGSEGNLVTAVFDQNGKRCILDGGFTRLYVGWQTAGTARYVKNAAAWLMNLENKKFN